MAKATHHPAGRLRSPGKARSGTPSSVRLGARRVTEEELLNRLSSLRNAIENWARERDLWKDAWFHVPYLYHDECPRPGDVLYLSAEGPLRDVLDATPHEEWERLHEELVQLIEDNGFYSEQEDHLTRAIIPKTEELADDYLALYRWQWLQRLASIRLVDIHKEVFEQIATHPDVLRRLTWRQYEELLDAIFRNQGFRTELGPGTNDGGVDIRLYQSNSIPELVTLVQAKRYNSRPIALDTVAALFGVAVEQQAAKAMLATTSRFQPRAVAFARSVEQRVGLPPIELVDSKRVASWCADIAKNLEAFFSTGSLAPLVVTLNAPLTELTGKVVVAHDYKRFGSNQFCVVETDMKHEAILRRLPTRRMDGDSLQGRELPDETRTFAGSRFVAFKRVDQNGHVSFWGERSLFYLWDGTPQHFGHDD